MSDIDNDAEWPDQWRKLWLVIYPDWSAEQIEEHLAERQQIQQEAHRLQKEADAASRSEAWPRLLYLLEQALADPLICRSRDVKDVAAFFLEVAQGLRKENLGQFDMINVIEALIRKQRAELQHETRNVLKREVQDEWQRDNASYKSKMDFARIKSARLLADHQVIVTERQIRDEWLKGL